MHFDFKILGSSSSGNAALLSTHKTNILIDAGFSAKKLKQMLSFYNKSIEDIDAVFITHEHADHIAGLNGLSAYKHLEFFTNVQTARHLEEKLKRKLNFRIFQTGSIFDYKDLRICTFSTPHDAYDPVGYVFSALIPNPSIPYNSIAWLTDLGHINDAIRALVKNADILVLEANYDPDLLERDSLRPFAVKQRIKSKYGHLSNQDAYHFLQTTMDALWKQIYLAHLSPHCNCKNLVQTLFESISSQSRPYTIEVVDPHQNILNLIAS